MSPVSADPRTRVRFRTLAVSAVVVSLAVSGCTRVGDVDQGSSRLETDDSSAELARPERDETTTTAAEGGPEVSTPSTTTPIVPETTMATVLGETTIADETTTSQPGIVLSTIAPTTAPPTSATTSSASTTPLGRPEQQTGSAAQTAQGGGAGTTGTTSGVQVATTATTATTVVSAGDTAAETTTSIVSTTQAATSSSGDDSSSGAGASASGETSAGTSGSTPATSGGGESGGASETDAPTDTTAETTTTAPSAEPEATTTTAAPTTTTTARVLGTYEELVEVAPNGAPIVANTAERVAAQLLVAEDGIRQGKELQRNAHLQQVIYRRIARNPRWDSTILAAMPEDYRASVTRNIEARRTFLSVASYPDVLKQWRIDEPIEGNTLLGYYQEAQDLHGVPWTYLAAMNLVNSGMGRIHVYSTLGAHGPMQFLPETWEQYGNGGDIRNHRAAIRAAARMLADNGFASDPAKALYAFNPNDAYVTGVTAYARILTEEPEMFWGYYYWEVYTYSSRGDLWFDQSYIHKWASSVDDWLEDNPQAN